jgi:heme A synthase
MIFQDWIRQTHRWLGIVLTLAILTNFLVMAFGRPPAVIVYAPLVPLALLILSGLYMFLRPYLRKAERS